jgi:hypothetical protein
MSNGSLPSETTSDHFWIQYETPTGGLVIQDYKDALDASWDTEVDTFGWASPPIKAGTPNGKYHVRVVDDLDGGLYGFVSSDGTYAGSVGNNPATSWNDVDAQASCMVLRHNYQGFESTALASLRSTVAHEFHHSIQFGYGAISGSNRPDTALIEGSATWMEDEVFDDADDNHHFLWPPFDSSVGQFSTLGNAEYAFWVILRAMTERYGTGVAGGGEQVMQDFWESTSQSSTTNMLTALNAALVTRGTTLADAYHAAAVALKFNRTCTGTLAYPYCLEEGPLYVAENGPTTPVEGPIASVGGTYGGTILDNYALRWVSLPLTPALYTVSLSNTSVGGQLRMTVACDTGTELVLTPLASTVGAGANAQIDALDTTGCSSAIAVITNQAQTASNPTSSTARSYQLSTFPPRDLTLSATGNGILTPSPLGADCGTGCYRYDHGQAVTITAAPDSGWGLASWGDACSTETDLDCVVTMDADQAASATFGPLQTLTIDPVPVNGSVTGPGIGCPGDCTEEFAQGAQVTLTAVPGQGYGVDTWSGACAAASGETCLLTMSGPLTASLTFQVVHPLIVSINGTGTGTVASDQPGISCDPSCSREYSAGEAVTLTATPGTQSEFTGWGGDCAAFGTAPECDLTLDGPKTVSAVFTANIYRPDGRIRKSSSSSYLGNNIYTVGGTSQRLTSSAGEGKSRTFVVRIENDGNVVDSFRISGSPNNGEFRVTYKAGSTSINGPVKAGTYLISNLAPGAARLLTVRIKAKLASEPGDAKTVRVTATSTNDGTKRDAVKARLRVR